MKVRKIVSGGQTGADRAALDFALENDFEIGGWIPRNRWAEDGRIGGKYQNLRETVSDEPEERTRLNVLDSDATLIISHGEPRGGTKFTLETARELNKPYLPIDFEQTDFQDAVELAQEWLISIECEIINVAGARQSEDTLIYNKTRYFLERIFGNAEARTK